MDTDWTSLDTPFGPRTGGVVPTLLERLDAPDARVRSRALQDLHGRLVAINGGYGTPFLPVALAAVPRLAARLESPGPLAPQLGQVLTILGDVAAGNHRLHVGRGLPRRVLSRTDIGPAREVQAAVGADGERIVARLGDDDAAVRAGAAFALAWLPDLAPASLPALRARVGTERDAPTRATMLLALGYLRAPVDVLRAHRDAKPPVGACAALGAMLSDPREMDADADVALASSLKPVVKTIPFLDGALLRLRTVVLGAASVRRGDLERHLALVARLPPELQGEAAGWTALIAAGAGAGDDEAARGPRLDPAELPERSRTVLRALAATLRTARDAGLHRAFARAGLFGSVDCNERALGVDPPGPLDARVEGHPLWWWLHGVRSGRVAWEHWRELLGGCDARAVLADAAGAPFELYRDLERHGRMDFAGLIELITRSADALGVPLDAIDSGLATLRGYAARQQVAAPTLQAPWP